MNAAISARERPIERRALPWVLHYKLSVIGIVLGSVMKEKSYHRIGTMRCGKV